tara:strand:+ start:428 stop:829 length:402 start_codon:yes stop_codon:yes gene_type:complete
LGSWFSEIAQPSPPTRKHQTQAHLHQIASASTDRSWNKDPTASPGRTVTSTTASKRQQRANANSAQTPTASNPHDKQHMQSVSASALALRISQVGYDLFPHFSRRSIGAVKPKDHLSIRCFEDVNIYCRRCFT